MSLQNEPDPSLTGFSEYRQFSVLWSPTDKPDGGRSYFNGISYTYSLGHVYGMDLTESKPVNVDG